MSNINSVVITGNLTRDPELRSTPGGQSVCQLRVAVNGRVKRNDQWQDEPNYFDVTVWGGQAENCATYLAKGRKVGVNGRLRWREWESSDGSGKRQAVDIVAHTVEFLSPPSTGNGGQAPPQQQPSDIPADTRDFGGPSHQATAPDDDPIPF